MACKALLHLTLDFSQQLRPHLSPTTYEINCLHFQKLIALNPAPILQPGMPFLHFLYMTNSLRPTLGITFQEIHPHIHFLPKVGLDVLL